MLADPSALDIRIVRYKLLIGQVAVLLWLREEAKRRLRRTS